ncbi:hypothetical protein BDA96_01G346400 [Sorghum bicolor]|uniref:Uncharacterized protein n=2 Tax=Sorghum bicolor TaxID=4558 RepID=A0A921V0D6_SORBI|nr:hypothetical protein BDA96_01G346400 [Sorghum bicolor]OQU92284.1 hypothetical protein SORBI_3001G322766 [Sorghum bicolor]
MESPQWSSSSLKDLLLMPPKFLKSSVSTILSLWENCFTVAGAIHRGDNFFENIDPI